MFERITGSSTVSAIRDDIVSVTNCNCKLKHLICMPQQKKTHLLSEVNDKVYMIWLFQYYILFQNSVNMIP